VTHAGRSPQSGQARQQQTEPRFTSILRPLVNPTTNLLLLLADLPLAVLISTANNRLPALLP
jgi:hypothetical protein